MPIPSDWLEQLAEEFDLEAIKVRDAGRGIKLCYLEISALTQRLDDVLGSSWSIEPLDGYPKIIEHTIKEYKASATAKPTDAIAVTAISAVNLIVQEVLGENNFPTEICRRFGVGSDTTIITDRLNSDEIDSTLKTSHAEAIKKAGHEYGIGRYLWDRNISSTIIRCKESNTPYPARKEDIEKLANLKKVIGIATNDILEKDYLEPFCQKNHMAPLPVAQLASDGILLRRFVNHLRKQIPNATAS